MPVNLSEIAENLEIDRNGLWSSRTDSDISYPEAGNETYFAIEDSSFWFRHRNNCILHAVKSLPPSGTFFDVGGGNGYVARALQETGMDVVLVEPGRSGASNAKKRGIRHVVRSTLHDAGFVPETLPAVGLFDVVEHIQDDRAFLTEINRLLAPRGRVYITVPAFTWLWSQEDKDAGHWRRYTLTTLSEVLQKSGYTVESANYIFGFLPYPIFLLRVLPYRFGLTRQNRWRDVAGSDHKPNYYVGRALEALTRRELSRIAAGHRLSIGGSCLVVAQKR